jgi:hypothetical protein
MAGRAMRVILVAIAIVPTGACDRSTAPGSTAAIGHTRRRQRDGHTGDVVVVVH